jgi:hypothetical protein
MQFLNPALLAGGALIAIPVILHLLMRNKPKRVVFPALRLVQLQHRQNKQRMRLRHLWLLAARMGVFLVIVAAIARPTVPAGHYSPTLWDWVRLGSVGAMLTTIYTAFASRWKQDKLSAHEQRYRFSLLNSATAIAAAVLFILLVLIPYVRRVGISITEPNTLVGQDVPVNGVLLFDVSPSMGLQFESKTRLELARQVARDHVARLPAGSRIAVADTATTEPIRFQSDLTTAVARIDALAVKPTSGPVTDRLDAVLQLLIDDAVRSAPAATGAGAAGGKANDGQLREVYIFTDLTQNCWRSANAARLKQLLAELPNLGLYVLDVGVEQPQNVGVTRVTLSDQVVATGASVVVQGLLESTGITGEQTVVLAMENAAGKMAPIGREVVKVSPTAGTPVRFVVPGLTGPIHQGELRLQGGDQMSFDDVRSFTIEVRPAPEILLVADSASESQFLQAALAPPLLVQRGTARYRCTLLASSKLSTTDLRKYAAVCLLNVAKPTEADWTALLKYATEGGGVACVLGERVEMAAYLGPTAKSVLPAELMGQVPFNPPENLDLANLTHPVLQKLSDWGGPEVTAVQFRRFWRVAPGSSSSVICTFTDQRRSPAFVESLLGKGRSMLFVSPLKRDFNDSRDWNDLVSARPFVVIADQWMRHLSQQRTLELTLFAGNDVVLPVEPAKQPVGYLLRMPDRRQVPGDIPAEASSLVIKRPDQLGNYRVFGRDPRSPLERGFSINSPSEESQLGRLPRSILDDTLGADKVSVSRSIEELERKVGTGRVGREAAAVLLALLVVVFLGEHVLANWFYASEQDPGAAARKPASRQP